jgi:predicted nucleic acid-binding protein
MQFMTIPEKVFLDAGILIGAVTSNDPRHQESRLIVEAARSGEIPACTSVGVTDYEAGILMLDMAGRYNLTARRVHDARHAATALFAGVRRVYTYDVDDWRVFSPDGIIVTGPESIL